jgi:hypothetical protein
MRGNLESHNKVHGFARIILNIKELTSSFEDQGYCVIPSLIDPSRAAQVQAILAAILEGELKDSHREAKCQRVGRIAVKDPAFLDLMCHPVIVDFWKKRLGPDIICSTWSANALYPGHGALGVQGGSP